MKEVAAGSVVASEPAPEESLPQIAEPKEGEREKVTKVPTKKAIEKAAAKAADKKAAEDATTKAAAGGCFFNFFPFR